MELIRRPARPPWQGLCRNRGGQGGETCALSILIDPSDFRGEKSGVLPGFHGPLEGSSLRPSCSLSQRFSVLVFSPLNCVDTLRKNSQSDIVSPLGSGVSYGSRILSPRPNFDGEHFVCCPPNAVTPTTETATASARMTAPPASPARYPHTPRHLDVLARLWPRQCRARPCPRQSRVPPRNLSSAD